eukprot:CAMPEP_0182857330 /NCGR_PEP_ID=MMETSP0034_2-20130328/2985_1 /TAXON_ID=156128 /ORGANISM="Nephroselmis pyriformis, Strain CCMP717" /LENGTH=510 /DNA_ID=CAMNT_0024988563 /DNA_START=174 /DNA_END=1703 /DNA_ORIENTATION=-
MQTTCAPCVATVPCGFATTGAKAAPRASPAVRALGRSAFLAPRTVTALQASRASVARAGSFARPAVVCKSSNFNVDSVPADAFPEAGQVCAILGSQWGDEGKGKLVDVLAQKFDVVARGQGGANAGHTIYDLDGNKYALHLIPSGILNPKAQCLVGNGVVVNLPGLFSEIDELEKKGVSCDGRLVISDRAHLLFDFHKEVDGLREAELAGKMIGTTKRGIGPAYSNKTTRNGARVGDLKDKALMKEKIGKLVDEFTKRFSAQGFTWDAEAEAELYEKLYERLAPFIGDTIDLVNQNYDDGKRILVEGANATMLDLDFGTYPFVTSSNPSIGGVISGLGIAPNKIDTVIGVVKAYTTRVGAGPYPTELHDQLGEDLRAAGGEYGTTTGRPRRCGWLDMVALKYAVNINGFTHLNITKLDVLTGLPEIKIGVGYKYKDGTVSTCSVPADLKLLEECEVVYETLPGWTEDISVMTEWDQLPANAQAYVKRVEELTGVETRYIGVGPGRLALVI